MENISDAPFVINQCLRIKIMLERRLVRFLWPNARGLTDSNGAQIDDPCMMHEDTSELLTSIHH